MEKKEGNVLFTGKYWEARIIKYLLEGKGVRSDIADETNSPFPSKSFIPDAYDVVTVRVSTPDYEKAKLIVSEYKKLAQNKSFDSE